jgi:hypothetical protein
MIIWFLRLFSAYRELELSHRRLSHVVGVAYEPTLMGLADAVGVTARSVLSPAIRVEVTDQRVPRMRSGMVRIIVQEAR